MSSIDYAILHEINLPVEHMGTINSIVDPCSYIRLFNKQSAQQNNKTEKNKNDKYNINNDINILSENYKFEQNRSKNLMSLSLIFRAIKKSKYNNNFCTVRLNTLLTFELYITLSHHINSNNVKLDKLYENQAKFDPLTTNYNELQEEIMSILNENESLKELNDSVVKSLRPENLYELMVDYNKFTPDQHAAKCVL